LIEMRVETSLGNWS